MTISRAHTSAKVADYTKLYKHRAKRTTHGIWLSQSPHPHLQTCCRGVSVGPHLTVTITFSYPNPNDTWSGLSPKPNGFFHGHVPPFHWILWKSTD